MALDPAFTLLVILILFALAFDYINGFHDTANAIATVVATKVLPPWAAVLGAAVLNFIGAHFGKVALSVGKDFVNQDFITMETLIFALLTAIAWNLFTWYYGLPSSSSHALFGSLIGVTVFSHTDGWQAIYWDNVFSKIIYPMIYCPLFGFIIGFIVMVILTWCVWKMDLFKINQLFGKLQLVSAAFMAYSHGSNDAQKTMGIIALALMTYYHIPAKEFHIPDWVIFSCALAMGLGTMSGGWKIIRTLGSKMIKIQPIHGFAAETTASGIILAASQFGIPLSTTHVITSSIMGVGATKRFSALKWGVVGNILWAWVLTIPLTFFVSGALFYAFKEVSRIFAL
jgi:inorganic phosphate transporter, PiT family